MLWVESPCCATRDHQELRTEPRAVQHSERARMELGAFTTSFETAVYSMIRACVGTAGCDGGYRLLLSLLPRWVSAASAPSGIGDRGVIL
ncbi:hypothetical protein PI125_g26651 [Phytophthora idaei]|nr:hypothetical protein PI125_g26651 [Phytophthora idaei]